MEFMLSLQAWACCCFWRKGRDPAVWSEKEGRPSLLPPPLSHRTSYCALWAGLVNRCRQEVLALGLTCFHHPLLFFLSLFAAVEMTLDYNVRAFLPKWEARVPWLSVAMAVLICESKQPTLPSQDLRAEEPLERLPFGS